jgi:hypothetical protein|tara:strand:+ start:343 stop:522 length:180 start_codon:yes stop_codon:yes gene_type:complete
MKTVFDDKSLLEFFKTIRDVNEAQKELNHITNKRIALLEKRINDFNSLKPLKLTPDMEL